MAQTSMTVRIDSEQKGKFDQLSEQFGMSANTAINIFVRQVIRSRSIPFKIAADSDEIIRKQAIATFKKIREEAEAQDGPELSLEEINAEIDPVRATRTAKL